MGARVVVIDNYDSFVYNLVQYLGELGAEPTVFRHDEITVDELAERNADGILISPGPGTPDDAGISNAVIEQLGSDTPILGVCLGHQCIGQVFGGRIVRAPTIMHGKTSWVNHDGYGVFAGLADPFEATRYHSLVIEPDSMPDVLTVTASTDEGVIMGVAHKDKPIQGVQFHPESILTTVGHDLMRSWLAGL
jgi:anthranilate synthase/aminodeoxychorismate synthase-like glutamine amidotransferase